MYREIFENRHVVMFIIDPATGEIVDANPAAERFYGWSRETLRSMRITEINALSPADVQAEMDRARTERASSSTSRTGSPTAAFATSRSTAARWRSTDARSCTPSSST